LLKNSQNLLPLESGKLTLPPNAFHYRSALAVVLVNGLLPSLFNRNRVWMPILSDQSHAT
jgi:hypothetical protein